MPSRRNSDHAGGAGQWVQNVKVRLLNLSVANPDHKIVLARQLIRENKSLAEMMEPLGYKSTGGVSGYLKRNHLHVPNHKTGPHHEFDDEARHVRSVKMKAFAAKGPHPNDWRGRTNREMINKRKEAAVDRFQQARAAKVAKREQRDASIIDQVRQLIDDGMSLTDIAKTCDYTLTGMQSYIKRNKLPTPKPSPRSAASRMTPEQKEAWSAKLRAAHARRKAALSASTASTPIAAAEEKKVESSIRVTTPSWFEEARRRRAAGETPSQLAKAFNVSPSRISQVTSPNWEKYVGSAHSKKGDDIKTYTQEANVADRKFDTVTGIVVPNTFPQQFKHGVIIRCSHEGCKQSLRFLRHPGERVSPVHAAQWFRGKGWAVGGGPNADRCPEHVRSFGTHKAPEPMPKAATPEDRPYGGQPEQVREEALAKTVEAINGAAEAEREMSRSDKRIIFSKLQDVYADEATGYRGEWTDAKVASDLGVPLAWIVEVRDENFGPEKNSAVIAKALEDARAMAREIEGLIADIKSLDADINAKVESHDKLYEAFEAKAKAFSDLYKSIAA